MERVVRSNRRILVVCQYYYPENFNVTPFCEELVKKGNDVTVLTGLPNYPLGKILPEYKNKKKRLENINGVHVVRVNEIGRKKGPIFLALNYLSFMISASHKVKKLNDDFDIVLIYQLSPVLMALPGLKIAKKKKIPILLYCLDLWPESLKMYIKNERNIVFKFFDYISRKIYNSCNLICVQSPSFLDYFKDKHNILEDHLKFIPSFGNDNLLNFDYNVPHKGMNFLFLGNVGIAQNLISVLFSIKELKKENVNFHIVGDGTELEDLKKYAKKNNLDDKVHFYGRRPVEDMPSFYNIADVCIVSLNSNNLTGETIPAKLQEYMAAGKAIIAMASGSVKNILDEANCGLCSSCNDIELFKNNIEYMADNPDVVVQMGKNARKYYLENFTKARFMKDMNLEIEKLIGDNKNDKF